VIAIEAQPGFACVQCVTVRDGQVVSSQSFFPSVPHSHLTTNDNDLYQEIFETFIAFYYVEFPERIPALIVLDERVTDLDAIIKVLSQLRAKNMTIQPRPRGTKARWMDFTRNNLKLSIAEHVASAATINRRYQALIQLLDLPNNIVRMECFDISHTQGQETIASCVVFDAQGPKKSEYRRFNIEGITPGDDYAAMEQAITRRFKRLVTEQNLPDILIIDGGKGQVGVAVRVLEALAVKNVTILGIAKGPDRKAGWERLILVTQNIEITLPSDSPALHLLQHIRDEAHRFAITAHRKKRQKAGFESTLENIEGIGPKRRKALLQYFGGLRELAKAPADEIARVTGVNAELAHRIYTHFHQ